MIVGALIIMGVAGCGKSTVGLELAKHSQFEYLDGDDLHPPKNIEKMSQGTPLEDDDRWPWLQDIGIMFKNNNTELAIGCSALKQSYRKHIAKAAQKPVHFIHLAGSKELIATRMGAREKHFMPTSLLNSQFAALEPLGPDELGVEINIDQDISTITADILAYLKELKK